MPYRKICLWVFVLQVFLWPGVDEWLEIIRNLESRLPKVQVESSCQVAVVFIFLSHWATALSPSIFDAIIPIFSEVTLYKPHNALLGQSLCFQMKKEAPLARRSYNELGGGVGSPVICSISVLMVLSTHSFIYSFIHYSLFSWIYLQRKDSRIFPLRLGTEAKKSATTEGAWYSESDMLCSLYLLPLPFSILFKFSRQKMGKARAGDTWSWAWRALGIPWECLQMGFKLLMSILSMWQKLALGLRSSPWTPQEGELLLVDLLFWER